MEVEPTSYFIQENAWRSELRHIKAWIFKYGFKKTVKSLRSTFFMGYLPNFDKTTLPCLRCLNMITGIGVSTKKNKA